MLAFIFNIFFVDISFKKIFKECFQKSCQSYQLSEV